MEKVEVKSGNVSAVGIKVDLRNVFTKEFTEVVDEVTVCRLTEDFASGCNTGSDFRKAICGDLIEAVSEALFVLVNERAAQQLKEPDKLKARMEEILGVKIK